MLCHLNFKIDKQKYKKYFFDNFSKGQFHKYTYADNKFSKNWYRLFNIEEFILPITKQLGIENLNIYPRFSFQFPNSQLGQHIDKDRIVAINLNLLDEEHDIIIEDTPIKYENALIDVGAVRHNLITSNMPRLILKYAIRDDWQKIYKILDSKKLIDHNKTKDSFSNYKNYISKIKNEDVKYVR